MPRVRLSESPRLADFALWVSACGEALGIESGDVMIVIRKNGVEARSLALEASPLFEPLAALAREGFTGTVAELKARLDCMVSDALRRSVRWPKAPNILSNALRRMIPSLRAAGIELQFGRNDEQGRRMVSVIERHRSENTVSHRQ